MKYQMILSAFLCAASVAYQAQAKELQVKITEAIAYSTVTHDNSLVKVQRIQDTDHTIDATFARTSRPCPPYCINPISIAEGVHTVAELEVIKFMETSLYRGAGVMVDARTPSWYQQGTIPGSVNIPFTEFEKPADTPELAQLLERLGAKPRGEVHLAMRILEGLGLFDGNYKTLQLDFTNAKEVLLWCNGPWCGQSPRAIKALISLGYPADKLYYYRGGMQDWQSLGMTTVTPTDNATVAAN